MAVIECSLVRDLEATRDHVRALHEFFCQHAKLCNAHAVGFFTEDHWRNIVKADWRSLLLEIEEETEWVTELKVPHGEQRDYFSQLISIAVSVILRWIKRFSLPCVEAEVTTGI